MRGSLWTGLVRKDLTLPGSTGQGPSPHTLRLYFSEITRDSGKTATVIYKVTVAFKCKNVNYFVAAIAKVLLVQN